MLALQACITRVSRPTATSGNTLPCRANAAEQTRTMTDMIGLSSADERAARAANAARASPSPTLPLAGERRERARSHGQKDDRRPVDAVGAASGDAWAAQRFRCDHALLRADARGRSCRNGAQTQVAAAVGCGIHPAGGRPAGIVTAVILLSDRIVVRMRLMRMRRSNRVDRSDGRTMLVPRGQAVERVGAIREGQGQRRRQHAKQVSTRESRGHSPVSCLLEYRSHAHSPEAPR